MNKKHIKNLIFLSIGIFGIQCASSLQLTHMSNIYKFLGAPSSLLPILWLSAPITGLLVQPLIGLMSDDTSTRFGKRKPYIFFWNVVTLVILIVLPVINNLWLSALLFWFLMVGINGATEACKALTTDLIPNETKTLAFSWQTIASGLGAGLAAAFPWLFHLVMPKNFFNFATQYAIPYFIQYAFWCGAITITITSYFLLFHVKERSIKHQRLLSHYKQKYPFHWFSRVKFFMLESVKKIRETPGVIVELIPAQFCTWIAIFIFWLYFNLALAQHYYGLIPGAIFTSNSHYQSIFQLSTIQASLYFSLYQIVSVMFAAIIPLLTRHFMSEKIHGCALAIGGTALTAFVIFDNLKLIYILMIGIGVMWGSVCTIPQVIVAQRIPKANIGIYLGIFNITVTLPQVFVGFILGPIYHFIFQNHAIYSILLSSIMLFIASYLMFQLKK